MFMLLPFLEVEVDLFFSPAIPLLQKVILPATAPDTLHLWAEWKGKFLNPALLVEHKMHTEADHW